MKRYVYMCVGGASASVRREYTIVYRQEVGMNEGAKHEAS